MTVTRWTLAAILVANAGCEPVRDAFTAQEDIAAVAGSERLPAGRLGDLLGAYRAAPVTAEAVRVLGNLWIDYTLLAQASADGDSLTDSATVAAATWPQLQQRLVDQFHNQLLQNRVAKVDSTMVDSAYRSGDLRVLDHILVSAGSELTTEQRAAKRQEIEGIQRELARGGSFGSLAAKRSEDTSREQNGRLGVVERGQTVRPFEDAAWALEPGGISGIVETQFGFHLIHRPPLDAVRQEFERGLVLRMTTHFDSVYLDSMTRARDIQVKGSAPATVRDALTRLEERPDSRRTLTTYRGGKFTEGDFVHWVSGFPLRTRNQLAEGPDSTIRLFLEQLTRSKILVEEAQAAGVHLPAEEWERIRGAYVSQLGFLRHTMGITPEALADSAGTPEERRRLAQLRVETYLHDLLNEKRSLVEPLVFLAYELRARTGARLRPGGMDAALARARDVRAALPAPPPSGTGEGGAGAGATPGQPPTPPLGAPAQPRRP